MTKEALLEAKHRIDALVHLTPVMSSRLIDEQVGARLYLKCENFQRMGAFKMRGASNAILQLSDEQMERGVVTHSSGNFAQAVSLAAQSIGVRADIVMPENAPAVKKEAVRGYGGNIIECESTATARAAMATKVTQEKGASFIHPSNDLDVIIGNASAAMELLEEQTELDYIYTPVGGGGLIAGTSLAAHYFGLNCIVRGGEPEGADDAFRSLASGEIETNDSVETIADGLRTNLGEINFPIIQSHVEGITLVSEAEIIAAMKLVWTRMKIIIEPSSAVALAAVIRDSEKLEGKRVGIIVSGGNVDLSKLPFAG